MPNFCHECGKVNYRTGSAGASVAAQRNRTLGLALRAYPCPHHATWHLTSSPARRARDRKTRRTAETPDYRRRMAGTLAERIVVRRADLVDVPGAGADPQYSITAAHGLIDVWCTRGLAEVVGPVVIAADPAALLDIAALGWSAWMAATKATRATGKQHDLDHPYGTTSPELLATINPHGPTVIAVDVPSPRTIATRGWSAWMHEHQTDPHPLPVDHQ